MPVGLWGDADGSRLREAYFATYPGVWRHGDWLTITERGSCIVEIETADGIVGWGECYGPSAVAKAYIETQFAPRIVEILAKFRDLDAENVGGVLLGETFKPQKQESLPGQRRELRQALLNAQAFGVAGRGPALGQRIPDLRKGPVERDAGLVFAGEVLRLFNQGLQNRRHIGIARFLVAGERTCIPPQIRQMLCNLLRNGHVNPLSAVNEYA